jgi:Rieske Fe-S protein
MKEKGISRRDFLRKSLWGTLSLLAIMSLAAFWVSLWPKPKVGNAASKVVVGEPADFPVGSVTYFRENRFYISRVETGFLAMTDICPHLACIVLWMPDEPSEDNLAEKGRFNCPCHVSTFDRYGEVKSGPSPRPVDLHPITLEATKLVVDTNTVIRRQAYEKSQPLKV